MKTKSSQQGALKAVWKAETDIRRLKIKLSKLRSKLTPETFSDVEFSSSTGAVKLSKLFGNKKELILIHNMGTSCPYCTLWADGFSGLFPHLENRAAFAVESPNAPAAQARFAKSRGWKFKMVSSEGTTFRKDSGFEGPNGDPWPGVSVFVKGAKGKIQRVNFTGFGPGDNYCAAWDLFDLLPGGSKKWSPRLSY